MSWKLFGQIVLLILIAAFLMCAAKCSMYSCRKGNMKACHSMMSKKMCSSCLDKLCPSCSAKLQK